MFRTPDGKKIADATSEQIFKEINDFLKEPRFAGDSCIVLTMPAATLVKSAEKLNTAILEAYRELGDPKTGMTRILVAIEDYVEVERLAVRFNANNPDMFPDKYSYMYGLNYFISLTVRK